MKFMLQWRMRSNVNVRNFQTISNSPRQAVIGSRRAAYQVWCIVHHLERIQTDSAVQPSEDIPPHQEQGLSDLELKNRQHCFISSRKMIAFAKNLVIACVRRNRAFRMGVTRRHQSHQNQKENEACNSCGTILPRMA